MNYFNYFTEIENEFVRQRGTHMLISPLEWNLIETWKQRGIPLQVVLRGIVSTFESHRARPQRARKVNSLLYCQQEVESVYEEHRAARVGASEENGHKEKKPKKPMKDAESPFSLEAVRGYLVERQAAIEALRGRMAEADRATADRATADRDRCEAMTRASERLMLLIEELQTSTQVDSEGLESELTRLEELILSSLKDGMQPPELEELRREGTSQLRRFRQGMDPAIYEQTLDNFVAKGLRDRFQVPRLSLFYL
jgi:hypothetical protein